MQSDGSLFTLIQQAPPGWRFRFTVSENASLFGDELALVVGDQGVVLDDGSAVYVKFLSKALDFRRFLDQAVKEQAGDISCAEIEIPVEGGRFDSYRFARVPPYTIFSRLPATFAPLTALPAASPLPVLPPLPPDYWQKMLLGALETGQGNITVRGATRSLDKTDFRLIADYAWSERYPPAPPLPRTMFYAALAVGISKT